MKKLFSYKKTILWSLGIFNLVLLIKILIFLRKYALQCERGYNFCRESYSESYGEKFCNKCEIPLSNVIRLYNEIRLKKEYNSCIKDLHKCLKNVERCSNCGACPDCMKRLNEKWDYCYLNPYD